MSDPMFGIGFELEHQTLPPDPLHLSEEEKLAIIAFLRTLTDKEWERKEGLSAHHDQ